jgi:hypothetical protein
VKVVAVGFENEMLSEPENPENEFRVNLKSPWSQLKASGTKLESAKDPGFGQSAALAGAAPAKAKVPAAAKRAAPSLKRLFMIWKVMDTASY